jgi:hypothetical protein
MAIEVSIDAQPTGGLRVIGEIPPLRPCRLEGRNGVGKTVAVRLLSLASGHQPYSDDPVSWRSLRAQIGNATIRFSGLVGLQAGAQLTLTPDDWPDEVPFEIGDWLGTLVLDGDSQPASALFDRLEVVHLSGTERLDNTIDRRRGTYRVALRETAHRLRELEGQRLELGEMTERVAPLTPEQENDDRQRRGEGERRLQDLVPRHEKLQARLKALQKASTLQMLIEAGTDPDRDAEIARVRKERAEAEHKLKRAQAELTAAVKELSQGSAIQKELAKEERRLTRVRKRETEARKRRVELAELAGLPQVAESTDDVLPAEVAAEIAEGLAEATEKLRELEHALYRNALTDQQRAIHDELTVVVDGAVSSGNSDLVVGQMDDHDVTVGELAKALNTPPSRPHDIDDAQLKQLRETHAALRSLDELIEAAPSIERDKQEVLESIRRLRSKAPEQDALEQRVDHARTDQQDAQGLADALSRRLGVLQAGRLENPAEAESDRDEILTHEKVKLDQLPEAVTHALTEQASGAGELATTREIVADLEAADVRRRVARRTLAAQLRSEPNLGWARDLAGLATSGAKNEDVDWRRFSERLQSVRGAVASLVDDVEALDAVLTTGPGASGRYGDAIRQALEEEAVKDFSDRPLLEALFDSGTITHFDLGNSTVSWRTAGGEARSRPLTAFSSGEGALGFIRARLRQIAAASHDNRLIFLDEFGAFIAADARRPLAELLTGDETGSLASQIIVMLPLQVDYRAELDQTTGALHQRYTERVAQIDDHDYFVEEFSP